ncbi:hypothetical protein [Marinobacter sp. SS5-14b]|uniref:hypothetical protein n=1 Tax=Marinobacter sp. SS5-14b TaxID=3050456 RepID=UPI0026DF9C87|nr:hypothetical protein [Marinobacter sp. SS5-14b]
MMRIPVRAFRTLLLAFTVVMPALASVDESGAQTQRTQRALEVAGLSASVGEDDPRILYILPWQTPSLPRRPRTELNQAAPELLQPVSTTALENHRQFRETLNPLVLEPTLVVPALDKP